MKRMIVIMAVLWSLCGCAAMPIPYESDGTAVSETTAVLTASTSDAPTTSVTQPTPEVMLSLDGISVDRVFGWFKEVCLDAEFTYGGDASLVQKWTVPIRYTVTGTPTAEDITFLEDVCRQLNTVQGFPGIAPAEEPHLANLDVAFCTGEELVDTLGETFTTDFYGGTRFWYDNNAIYRSTICIRNDIDQRTRNTVIIEEIYNQLGPVQDTDTRKDSVIYQHSNENSVMSDVDLLILQLLYHPDIQCGMSADECERIINGLINEQIVWEAQKQ